MPLLVTKKTGTISPMKMYFVRDVLIRKEHFGILILLRNGQRFTVDGDLFDKFEYLHKKHLWPKATQQDLQIISELKKLNILTENKAESGDVKIINNPFISSDCLSFPRTIYWECTEKCNYRCLHCYSSSGSDRKERGLTLVQIKKMIDELASRGAEFLSIGGGEPLLYPHIYKTIAYARQKGLTIEMTSNGSLLNEGNRQKLKKSGLEFLQVSLDGITEKTYGQIRAGGYLPVVQKNIEVAAKEFVLSICTVANKLNVREIPKIIDYSKRIGAKHYRVLPLMSVGRGKEIEHLQLSRLEWQKLNHYILGRRKKEKNINIQLNENLVIPKQKNITWMPSDHFGCSAGRTTCSIDAMGNVYPCSFMEHPLLNCGNIVRQSLEQIWRKSKILQQMRILDHLNGPCGKCRYLSVCRGGCRAAAYLRRRQIDDSDYLCTVNKG